MKKWIDIFNESNLDITLLPENWEEEAIPLGNSKNLCNKKFSEDSVIIPLYRVYSKNTSNRLAYWKCYCENDYKYFTCCGRDIIRNHTKSCGCLRKKQGTERLIKYSKDKPSQFRKDYTGENFNTHLTALYYDHTENNYAYWAFQCDCGNPEPFITKVAYVYSHDVTHCPKCSKTRWLGPKKIQDILNANRIPYTIEKTFDGCEYKRKLRFDFFVEDSYCIEYNGVQHYEPFLGYYENKLPLYQLRDNIKKEYCKKNNIPLIIIPYTQLEKLSLNDLLVETSTFLYKGD